MESGRVATMSYDMLKGADPETREFLRSADKSGASRFLTTSVPAASYAMIEAQVASLTPKQRRKWKTVIVDNFGQRTSVRYNEAGIPIPGYNFTSHFENKLNGQKQGKLQTTQEWRAIKPMDLPLADSPESFGPLRGDVILMRRGNDAAMDGLPSSSQSMMLNAERVANHTGNHEPRNHSISVPKRAGGPVRG